jgi:hypothetical protein
VGSGFSATPHRPRRLLSQFSLTAVGGAFDELNLLNADGFKEIKHIEISGLARVVGSAVPEPSTWAILVAGFGLMGLVGYRKQRQRFGVSCRRALTPPACARSQRRRTACPWRSNGPAPQARSRFAR